MPAYDLLHAHEFEPVHAARQAFALVDLVGVVADDLGGNVRHRLQTLRPHVIGSRLCRNSSGVVCAIRGLCDHRSRKHVAAAWRHERTVTGIDRLPASSRVWMVTAWCAAERLPNSIDCCVLDGAGESSTASR